MKSFALFCKGGENGTDNIDIAEVHINIWKVHIGVSNPKLNFFFDFGLKIHRSVSSVCLYVPFEIKDASRNFDLVKLLRDSNELLCTVFNEDLKLEASPTSNYSIARKDCKSTQGDNEFCYLYQLSDSKFTFKPVKENERITGTIIQIEIQGQDELPKQSFATPVYIRFRISPKNLKSVVYSEHVSNDFLQSAFSEIDLFDFRLNEQRNIDAGIVEQVKTDGYKLMRFNKVHLFFMSETKENIQNGSSVEIDSRLLEQEKWKNYIPVNSLQTNYIAHHWKRCEKNKEAVNGKETDEKSVKKPEYVPFKDYRIFFSSVYPKYQRLKIFNYMSVIVLLGWCGSMLSFHISSVFDFYLPQYFKMGIIIVLFLFVFIYFLVINYGVIFKIFHK